jgi:alginate O-acetyltransferase complex protein AlgI
MAVVSLGFAGFCALVLGLYYVLPMRAQNILLLAASYAFYASLSWTFPLVLLVMTGADYALGRRVVPGRTHRRRWLALGILFNLAVLLFFKFARFFVPDMIRLLSGLGLPLEGLRILLPIGLSFYSLQAISYLVDVSRKQAVPADNIIDFALAMAYFPKLIAGPIERFRDFIPALARPRIVDKTVVSRSLTLLVIGLVRKVVVADTLLAAVPGRLYTNPGQFSAAELVIWSATFMAGLYNDFAGYTEIVRGVSGFFGIELSRNFAFPFFSRNFTEFWSRWHISLSTWLRDYIYFPVSRALARRSLSRFNVANLVLPTVVTMLASGLWHGTGWNFVVWGFLMGLVLIAERLPSLWRPVVAPEKRPAWRRYLATATLLICGLLVVVMFKASVPAALIIWGRILTWTGSALPDSRVFLIMIPALWIDWIQYRRKDEWAFLAWPRAAQAALLAAAVLAVFLFSRAQLNEPFIYQGF